MMEEEEWERCVVWGIRPGLARSGWVRQTSACWASDVGREGRVVVSKDRRTSGVVGGTTQSAVRTYYVPLAYDERDQYGCSESSSDEPRSRECLSGDLCAVQYTDVGSAGCDDILPIFPVNPSPGTSVNDYVARIHLFQGSGGHQMYERRKL